MAFELLGRAVRRFRLPAVNYGSAPIMIVSAQAGDVKTRYFDITLYDDNGDIDLTKYTTAKLYGTMPNGDVLMSTECEISPEGKNVIVQFSGGFTATCGRVACNIVFLNDDSTEQLTSQTFYVIVSSSQSGDLASENNEDYNELLSLLREIAAIEEKIETAETGRVDAEAARVLAENTRESNENKRETAEDTRQTQESTREASEAARVEAEKGRASAEQTRASNEKNRDTAETARDTAEKNRASAESARADAESKRVAAEAARTTAESKRADAESVRDTNETARKQNEVSRQSAEEDRDTAEQERVSNENARKSAESGRVTAESKRVTAESARETAETARATAENARATAESNRASEEKKRVDAESKRAAAETKRETAESARSSAEQSRVTEFETVKENCETVTQRATEVTEEMQGLIESFPNFATKAELNAVKKTAEEAIPATEKGAKGGVATLGSDGKVPSGQLPNFAQQADFEALGERVTAVENTNTTQGTDISGLKTRMTAVEGKNTSQDAAISTAQNTANSAKTTAEAAIPKTQMGASGGVATLGTDGKIPEAQLPSYVDDVLEFANKAAFPAKGESGKIYVAVDTNLTYRWSGSAYVEISSSLALGETSSTAYAGDKGKQNADDIASLKTRVGNVESKNTEQDTAISNAQSTADSAKSTASTAVQSVKGSNGVGVNKSGTEVMVTGVTADTNTMGVAKLHKEADCVLYSSDDGGATPAAVKKAIVTDSVASTFNATTEHRGTMSKEDKAKLDAFGAASTYATKTDVNAKYTKPSGGIPKTDLASAVQTSLGKADSALQSVPAATATVLGGVKIVKGSDGIWDITTT